MPVKYNTQIRRPLIPKALNSLYQYRYLQMYMTVTIKNCHIIQNLCSCFPFNAFNFHWKIYLIQFYLFTYSVLFWTNNFSILYPFKAAIILYATWFKDQKFYVPTAQYICVFNTNHYKGWYSFNWPHSMCLQYGDC